MWIPEFVLKDSIGYVLIQKSHMADQAHFNFHKMICYTGMGSTELFMRHHNYSVHVNFGMPLILRVHIIFIHCCDISAAETAEGDIDKDHTCSYH